MPTDNGAKLSPPVEQITKSVQELPVHILTSSGSDVDGEPMALTAATIQAARRELLLQARALGESSKALTATWNDIATNATLREE
jgi:hypothetical protein